MAFFKLLFVGVLLSAFGDVGAIQCHQCMYQSITSSQFNYEQGNAGCKDPFQATGIEVVECNGQCYANLTQVTFGGDTTEFFYRGCAADVEIDCSLFQGCQDRPESLACILCCDQNNCNGQDIKAFDQTIFKCFTCTANLDANGMPIDDNTCGRVDFDGTAEDINVLEWPCPSETCLTYVVPSGEGSTAGNTGTSVIARTCAEGEDFTNPCQNEAFYRDVLGYEINCCTTSLCNVGRSIPDPDATIKPAPVIDCYTCQANLTADGLPADQSSCGRADFDGSGQDAALWQCDTGVCLTLYIPPNEQEATSSVTRMCAPTQYISACDNPSALRLLFGFEVNVACCSENGCNIGGAVFEAGSTTERAVMETDGLDNQMTSLPGNGNQDGGDGGQQGGDGGGATKVLPGFVICIAFLFTYGMI